MNIKIKLSSILIILLFSFVVVSTRSHIAEAQQGSLYEMTGSVGAGGMSTAGVYQTDAMIGQAAIAQNAAGPYELGSGFWGGGLVVISVDGEEIKLFLPFILR